MTDSLRKHRLESGLSTEEVAQRLHLSTSVVETLEQGDVPDHVHDTFARGYLRNYAKLLGVDAEPIIASVFEAQAEEVEQAEVEAAAESVQASPQEPCNTEANGYQPQRQSVKQRPIYLGVGLAASVMVAVGVWMQEEAPSAQKQALAITQVEVETPKGKIISHLDEQTVMLDTLSQADNTAAVVEGPMAAGPMAAVVSYSSDAVEQTSESVLVEGDNDVVVETADGGTAELSFAFSDDCWIQIVDGNQAIIFSSVAKKDQALQLSGQPPFTVTLGYAPGVSVSYNGEPVPIKVRQNRHVAKLVLGNG